MNIQIYAGKKDFDTQKAERWFKERRISYQLIDLVKFGLSSREFDSVAAQVGVDALINKKSVLYKESTLQFMKDPAQIKRFLQENTRLYASPIVRNGKLATVGYCPEEWEKWRVASS